MATELEQSAFVLHSRPYRETSLLVTFFTEDQGKQNAIIKGVKGASKLARAKQAWLQPFQSLNISWLDRKTHSDLINIRLLEPGKIWFPLMGDGNICGLYLNELLYRMLYPSVVSSDLFKHYQQALYELSKSETRLQQAWILRVFEYHLLNDLGTGIELTQDAFGQTIQAETIYTFYLEQGLVPIDNNQEAMVVSGKCLLNFVKDDYTEACLGELKHLFRFILSFYLGNKPIQTRALFN